MHFVLTTLLESELFQVLDEFYLLDCLSFAVSFFIVFLLFLIAKHQFLNELKTLLHAFVSKSRTFHVFCDNFCGFLAEPE